jgi:hypothetical protein
METVTLPPKIGGVDVPADFVGQISQSRIYRDYERAFVKAAKLPLELSRIDMCCERHRLLSS